MGNEDLSFLEGIQLEKLRNGTVNERLQLVSTTNIVGRVCLLINYKERRVFRTWLSFLYFCQWVCCMLPHLHAVLLLLSVPSCWNFRLYTLMSLGSVLQLLSLWKNELFDGTIWLEKLWRDLKKQTRFIMRKTTFHYWLNRIRIINYKGSLSWLNHTWESTESQWIKKFS